MSAPAIVQITPDLSLETDPQNSLQLGGGEVYERHELELSRQRIAVGDTAVDIGAHIGYYTVRLSRWVGDRGRVYAFEPHPVNLAVLGRNLTRNRCDNVIVIPAACGDTAGTIDLYQCEFNSGMHRVYSSVVTSKRVGAVELVRAADVVPPGVRFVKIDVEGYELAALRGLQPALARDGRLTVLTEFSPLACIEAGGRPEALLDWAALLGLAPLELEANRWVPTSLARLKQACSRLDTAEVRELIISIRGQNPETLYRTVIEFLDRVGYARAHFESLALVRD